MSLVAIAALLASQVQVAQVGELSKDGFLALLSTMGYTTSNLKDPYRGTLTDGVTQVGIVVSFHSHKSGEEPFVGRATGRVEFDLPRFLEKKKLRDWLIREKFEDIKGHSYLGGRVVLEVQLATPTTATDEVKVKVTRIVEACRRLKRELGPLGGKQTDVFYQPGKAPLDLNAKLEEVEQEDLDYLRGPLKWGEHAFSGGGKGWITGAEPLGVQVLFNGMHGFRLGFSMISMGRPERKKLDRFLKGSGTIKWAEVSVQQEYVSISRWLDTSRGMTVRQIRDEVEAFASQVKALDLFDKAY